MIDDDDRLTNDQEHDLLLDALQALKDVVNADNAGDPYSGSDLSFARDVLDRGYRGGIRLNGEDD